MVGFGRERGQGTVEWVGLVTAVAVLLAAGAALAQAAGLGATVSRQLARAYCLVRGGDCEHDREPCVVRSYRSSSGLVVRLLVLTLGGDRKALVERLSDGTTRITRLDGARLGATAGVGGSLRIGRLGVGAELTASATMRPQGSRTWLVRSDDEARRLVAAMLADRQVRPPDMRTATVATELDGGGRLYAGRMKGERPKPAVTVRGGLGFDRTDTVTIDRRTGRRVISVAANVSAKVGLLTGRRERFGTAATAGSGDESYAIELDASGRPIDLQVTALTTAVPAIARPFAAGLGGGGQARGRSYLTTAHLDLTDPVNLALARDFIGSMKGSPKQPLPDLDDRLREQIERQAAVETRAYDNDESGGTHLAATLSAGVRLGAAYDSGGGSARLVAAASRGLDGQWLAREDCVAGRG